MLLLLLVYSYGVSAQKLWVNVTEEIVMQPGETVEKTVSIPGGYLDHADFERFFNLVSYALLLELLLLLGLLEGIFHTIDNAIDIRLVVQGLLLLAGCPFGLGSQIFKQALHALDFLADLPA